jgi:hypothetical protein
MERVTAIRKIVKTAAKQWIHVSTTNKGKACICGKGMNQGKKENTNREEPRHEKYQ